MNKEEGEIEFVVYKYGANEWGSQEYESGKQCDRGSEGD